jgi:wyosine [tRNA(Phe)-imidazoG37] synthetase (radical SAM superfamily)
MPSHQSVKLFGQKLGEQLGMCVLKERSDSRVVLVGRVGAKVELDLEI